MKSPKYRGIEASKNTTQQQKLSSFENELKALDVKKTAEINNATHEFAGKLSQLKAQLENESSTQDKQAELSSYVQAYDTMLQGLRASGDISLTIAEDGSYVIHIPHDPTLEGKSISERFDESFEDIYDYYTEVQDEDGVLIFEPIILSESDIDHPRLVVAMDESSDTSTDTDTDTSIDESIESLKIPTSFADAMNVMQRLVEITSEKMSFGIQQLLSLKLDSIFGALEINISNRNGNDQFQILKNNLIILRDNITNLGIFKNYEFVTLSGNRPGSTAGMFDIPIPRLKYRLGKKVKIPLSDGSFVEGHIAFTGEEYSTITLQWLDANGQFVSKEISKEMYDAAQKGINLMQDVIEYQNQVRLNKGEKYEVNSGGLYGIQVGDLNLRFGEGAVRFGGLESLDLRDGNPRAIGRESYGAELMKGNNRYSRQHCWIQYVDGKFYVIDESTNGTIADIVVRKTRSKQKNNRESSDLTPIQEHVHKFPRNSEKKESMDISRESDVAAIGDLHGDWRAYIDNLIGVGAIDQNGDWIGGNQKIVFHGDILADRGMNSFQILEHINGLRKQAKEQGGDILIIAGNHDDFLITYLTGRDSINGSPFDYVGSNAGLYELEQYGPVENKNRKKILKKMRMDPKGRLVLEEICNMKLAEQIDDTLYLHTNPTDGILQSILKYANGSENNKDIGSGIDAINTIRQKGLRQQLLGENHNIDLQKFNDLADAYLATSNSNGYRGDGVTTQRTSANKAYYQSLKENGINHIMHGHEGEGGALQEIEGVHIIDNDYGYGKGGRYNVPKSYSEINKNGQVKRGEKGADLYVEATSRFEQKHSIGQKISFDGDAGIVDGQIQSWGNVLVKYRHPVYQTREEGYYAGDYTEQDLGKAKKITVDGQSVECIIQEISREPKYTVSYIENGERKVRHMIPEEMDITDSTKLDAKKMEFLSSKIDQMKVDNIVTFKLAKGELITFQKTSQEGEIKIVHASSKKYQAMKNRVGSIQKTKKGPVFVFVVDGKNKGITLNDAHIQSQDGELIHDLNRAQVQIIITRLRDKVVKRESDNEGYEMQNAQARIDALDKMIEKYNKKIQQENDSTKLENHKKKLNDYENSKKIMKKKMEEYMPLKNSLMYYLELGSNM